MTGPRPDQALRSSVSRILRLQLGVTVAVSLAVLALVDGRSALAAGFGAMLGVLGTVVSARGVRRAGVLDAARETPSMVPMYLGALQKLLVVAAGAALGLVVLELPAAFLLGGLILSQLGYLAASVWILSRRSIT